MSDISPPKGWRRGGRSFIVVCAGRIGRAANPSAATRYIGSGEAASYRRLPPSEPQGPFMARTPARPDRAVKGNRPHDAGGSLLRGRQGGSVQDVAVGHLDVVETERADRLGEDHRAGHDGGRAVRVETLDIAPVLDGLAGQHRGDPLA